MFLGRGKERIETQVLEWKNSPSVALGCLTLFTSSAVGQFYFFLVEVSENE